MTRIASLLAGASMLIPDTASAVDYTIDQSHTHILFFVEHFCLSSIQGEFLEFDGTFSLDVDSPENSAIAVTIDVASLDSGHDGRDEHFLSADFFDAETFPTVTFTSTDVAVTGDNTAEVTGDLTIRDVTQPVTLDVTLNGMLDDHPFTDGTQPYVGFTATTTILRSDFGIELFVPAGSDDVEIRIEMDAVGPTA